MREYWEVQVVIGGCKQRLASWTKPIVTAISDDQRMVSVEAEWIDQWSREYPVFIRWPDVSAITSTYVPATGDDAPAAPSTAIIRCLRASSRPLKVAEIAAGTGLGRLTVTDLLNELESEGNVIRRGKDRQAELWTIPGSW